MNVDNVEVSHGIISEIMAAWAINEGNGRGNPHSGDNKDITLLARQLEGKDGAQLMPDSNTELAKQKQARIDALDGLSDPSNPVWKEIGGMTDIDAIAQKLGFKDATEQIMNPNTGQMESVSSYIATALDAKGKRVSGGGADDL